MRLKLRFLLLLDRLGIKKFKRTAKQRAFDKLFDPGLKKNFELAYNTESMLEVEMTIEQVMTDEEVASLKEVAETTEALIIKLGKYEWDVYHDFKRVCVSHKILQEKVAELEKTAAMAL